MDLQGSMEATTTITEPHKQTTKYNCKQNFYRVTARYRYE